MYNVITEAGLYTGFLPRDLSKVDTSTIDLRWSTHQSPIFEGRHIDHRSSKVNTTISEGRLIDVRKSTHPSPKVDTSVIVTSIFEGRHINIRKLTHRSSKVDASIFEDRRRKHHTYNSSSNIVHNCVPKSLEWTKLHMLICTCIKINYI